MSQIEKLIQKFNRVPIPNDISYDEVKKLAVYFGCMVKENAGRHSLHIVYVPLGTVIPIPTHGKHVKEVYIKQLKKLFEQIEEEA